MIDPYEIQRHHWNLWHDFEDRVGVGYQPPGLLAECKLCGSVFSDRMLHVAWHVDLAVRGTGVER